MESNSKSLCKPNRQKQLEIQQCKPQQIEDTLKHNTAVPVQSKLNLHSTRYAGDIDQTEETPIMTNINVPHEEK